MFVRLHAGDVGASGGGVIHVRDGATSELQFGTPGTGTHRLRMTWDASTKKAIFEVDEDYTGGAFVSDMTSGEIDGGDNAFTNANSHLFFGGDGSDSFDDFQIRPTNVVNVDTATFLDPVTIVGGTITDAASGTDITAPSVTLDGNVSPGASPGILSVNGDYTFISGSTFTVEIDGTSGAGATSGHDQLSVTGDNRTIAFNDAALDITLNAAPAIGSEQVYTIVDSTGTSPTLSGTFQFSGTTLNNDDTFVVGATTFRINYTAGDVTLTEAGNTAPVNTVPGPQTVAEDTTLAFTGGTLISVVDSQNNLASTQLSVLNGKLNVTLNGSASFSAGANDSATMTISGTQAEINATLATLTYIGNQDYNGGDTLTVL